MTQDLDSLKDTTVKRVSYELNKTKDAIGSKIDDITPSLDEINPIPKLESQIAITP